MSPEVVMSAPSLLPAQHKDGHTTAQLSVLHFRLHQGVARHQAKTASKA